MELTITSRARTLNIQIVAILLNGMYNGRSYDCLVFWWKRVAEERSFSLDRVLIEYRKNRWASCSKTGPLSLTTKALFVLGTPIHHAMVHGLFHAIYMHQSTEFWSLISEHGDAYARLETVPRSAWCHVFVWLDVDRVVRDAV